MGPLRGSLALAALFICALTSASAQGSHEQKGAPAGNFDFYVLALSWSPGFCEASGGVKGRSQCDGQSDLGFVVHGLWPQFDSGYPTYCQPGGRFVSRPALEKSKGLFPDEGLARYQWRKHGSCTGLGPAEYFDAARRARDLVRVPERLEKPKADTKVLALEIERAFAQVNPALRPDMMAIECGRRVFQEIRICLDKDLRGFRQCPEVDRGGCRAADISVPAVR